MTAFVRDLRHAFRALRKNPGFTSVAVLTLALGIGANTAIFSLVNAAFLQPLPFPEPGRLVAVWEDTPLFGLKYSPPALGNYVEWKARSQAFENIGALERAPLRLSGEGEAEEIPGSVVTASLFETLGTQPALGRTFLPEEDQPGAPKTVILSHHLWQSRFGGDPSIIGRQMLVNKENHTVVGVMPEGFRFPEMDQMWVPVGAWFSLQDFSDRGRHNLMVVGRLKPGVTLPQANEELRRIATQLSQEYPRTNTGVSVFASPLREHVAGRVRNLYGILLGAVGFVLLIACANLANLLLARAAARQREVAVRAALGASRLQIARQLLAESVLLSGLGAVLGLLLAFWSFRFFSVLLPSGIASMTELRLDPLVLAFTLGLGILTAVAFGAAPVLQCLHVSPGQALAQGGERTAGAAGAGRTRSALVVAEVAVSLLLVAGAALMIQSFFRLRGVDVGFPAGNLLTMRVSSSLARDEDPQRYQAFCREALVRIRAVPGVESAGFTTGVPVVVKGWYNGVMVEGADRSEGGNVPTVNYRAVTSEYLQTLRVPLRRGRYLEDRDGFGEARVAVINETMARMFWPDQDPIGKRFQQGWWGPEAPWYTVAGVVGDIRQAGLDAPPRPEMYLPFEHQRTIVSGLAIRTSVSPENLVEAVRREIRAVDPDQPVSDVRTMEQVLDRDVSQQRLQSTLLTTFSALALLLASVGMYGVLSYTVARRTREFGIRLALGARPADLQHGVVRHALMLAATGIVMGVGASLALERLLSGLLFGISATDPWTIGGAALLMLLVSALAALLPAWRATKVDPVTTLRTE